MSIRFGVLGLLTEEALHGYEVKQRFEDMFGGTWDLNVGSVYQVLQRLERDGLVQPVGERGDRGKLAYRTTAAGESALQEWLEDPESQPMQLREDVYIKLLLLSRNGRDGLDRLFNRQRRVYLQRLRDLADQERAARARGQIQLALLFMGGRLHTEADLKWLDQSVEELSGGTK